MNEKRLTPPVRRAIDARKVELQTFERAKDAVLEQIRVSDGHAAPGIVDQVAAANDLPVQTVQRALWFLSSQGRVVIDDELVVRAPALA